MRLFEKLKSDSETQRLEQLTKSNVAPQREEAFVRMGSRLYLPTERGYARFVKDAEKNLADFKIKYNDNIREYLSVILKPAGLRPEKINSMIAYYEKKHKTLDDFITAFSQESKESNDEPDAWMIKPAILSEGEGGGLLPPSKEDFFNNQFKMIIEGIDRPVWKIFLYLLYKDKKTCTSCGFGDQGQETPIDGINRPYGVTWQENGFDYRIVLMPGKPELTKQDPHTFLFEKKVSNEELKELAINLDEIVLPKVSDFDGDFYQMTEKEQREIFEETLQQVQQKLGMDDPVCSEAFNPWIQKP